MNSQEARSILVTQLGILLKQDPTLFAWSGDPKQALADTITYALERWTEMSRYGIFPSFTESQIQQWLQREIDILKFKAWLAAEINTLLDGQAKLYQWLDTYRQAIFDSAYRLGLQRYVDAMEVSDPETDAVWLSVFIDSMVKAYARPNDINTAFTQQVLNLIRDYPELFKWAANPFDEVPTIVDKAVSKWVQSEYSMLAPFDNKLITAITLFAIGTLERERMTSADWFDSLPLLTQQTGIASTPSSALTPAIDWTPRIDPEPIFREQLRKMVGLDPTLLDYSTYPIDEFNAIIQSAVQTWNASPFYKGEDLTPVRAAIILVAKLATAQKAVLSSYTTSARPAETPLQEEAPLTWFIPDPKQIFQAALDKLVSFNPGLFYWAEPNVNATKSDTIIKALKDWNTVKPGDTPTAEQARDLLLSIVKEFSKGAVDFTSTAPMAATFKRVLDDLVKEYPRLFNWAAAGIVDEKERAKAVAYAQQKILGAANVEWAIRTGGVPTALSTEAAKDILGRIIQQQSRAASNLAVAGHGGPSVGPIIALLLVAFTAIALIWYMAKKKKR